MALTKKKTVKKKPVAKDAPKNYQEAYEFLVQSLNWRSKCKDLVKEANELL